MEVLHRALAGVDVHLRKAVVCLRIQKGSKVVREVRSFGTTTPELLELRAWLVAEQCPIVVIESTGVYWKPIFNVLEGELEVILANAAHVKTLPGRKTDMRDAEWLAEVGAHGLVRGSFIPGAAFRQLRECTRYRRSLVRSRATEVNRLQKVLESANIKLGAVVSDVCGVSGRAMVRAMVAGEHDPVRLAGLARGSLRSKVDQLVPALTGYFAATHAFVIEQILDHIEYLEGRIEAIGAEVERRCEPFIEVIELLKTIPGVGPLTAEVIVAEIGLDMGRFATAHHLASWAGLCPGNNESAGRRRTGRTRRGNAWLRDVMCEAGWAAVRSKGTYLNALYRHLAFARGKGAKKALIAVAHSMLIAVWHILTDHVPYQELGPNHLAPAHPDRLRNALIRRLEKLGYNVTLAPTPLAA